MQRIAFAAAVVLAAGAVHAANGLIYFGAGVSQNKVDDIGNSVSHLDNTSWKLLAGVRPVSFFGVEGDYLDLGSHTDDYIGGTTRADAHAFAAYAVGYLPLPVPYLDVYGKAGLARWQLNGSTSQDLFRFSDDGTDFAWGLGAQVHFGNVGARLEYERFNITNTGGAKVFSLDVFLSLL
jgi:hypothetical protein